MALRRMVPTNFFKHPDILCLSHRDHRQVLLCLILCADDEGRELAHAPLLSREMGDYTPQEIEEALQSLATNDLIVLYQVGKHRYYSLTQWHKWQTIPPNRRKPSKCPAPPPSELHAHADELHAHADELHAHAGELHAQLNRSESNRSEGEERETPHNITPFPATTRTDTTNADVQAQRETTTQEVARILKLSPDQALTRLVAAYRQDPTISLLIEADAAREWIDDKRRNHAGKPMTVNFFRTWLKREQKETQDRQHGQRLQATGTNGPPVREERPPHATPATPPKRRNLMSLEAEYRAACEPKQEQGPEA